MATKINVVLILQCVSNEYRNKTVLKRDFFFWNLSGSLSISFID